MTTIAFLWAALSFESVSLENVIYSFFRKIGENYTRNDDLCQSSILAQSIKG